MCGVSLRSEALVAKAENFSVTDEKSVRFMVLGWKHGVTALPIGIACRVSVRVVQHTQLFPQPSL